MTPDEREQARAPTLSDPDGLLVLDVRADGIPDPVEEVRVQRVVQDVEGERLGGGPAAGVVEVSTTRSAGRTPLGASPARCSSAAAWLRWARGVYSGLILGKFP
ncbi:hypothetical protein [Streptomyces sp. DSM 40750]|uniref:hypothetical protein n=1 Tax=Streptomyces sp. DSM 40750 TaxID=2801030 RepID=UPI00214C32BD|nr:hypothetical protein [Streptomyces sp. DSM 40750]UUU23719.1 hypothetical protein JIX55_27580 [Streptomyces sp. DSM 40750]